MNATGEMVRVELTVFGDVQTMSYRYRLLGIAEEKQITGKLWNKIDKTVGIEKKQGKPISIIAEGDKIAIQEFIELINVHPLTKSEIESYQTRGELIPPQPLASVERIEGTEKFLPCIGEFKQFKIIMDDQDIEIVNTLRTNTRLIDRFRNDLFYNLQILDKKFSKMLDQEDTRKGVDDEVPIRTKVFDLENGKAYGYHIEVGASPFLLIKARRGYVMCGYLNMSTADRHGDVAGRIVGVRDFNEVLTAKVLEISE
ncbi:MAG: DUF1805 domain-containing protein, partial [Methanobacteriota archaeon]